MPPLLYALLLGWFLASAIMVAVWLLQRKTGNAGWVDAAWAGTIALLALLAATFLPHASPRRWIATVPAVLWGARLSLHIALRTARDTQEDPRYQKLRKQWGDRAQSRLFHFFQLQAAVATAFVIPITSAQVNPSPFPAVWDLLAILVFLIAFSGESIADHQLRMFKKSPANRGKTCRSGLWQYSRHPNYFFEWLHWWSYCLFAVGSPAFFLSLLGPAMMYHFLIHVTGIPISEARSLEARPDYAEYVRTTSPFFPRFPRK